MNDFWNKQLISGYYDKVLEDGLLKKRGLQSNWHHSTFLNVSKSISNSKRHLDFACGPGTFIGKYLDLDSLGVDISEKQIEYALTKYKNKGQFLTTEDFDFQKYEKNFDSISIIGLLEYLNDEEILKLMEQMFFVLSDNGKLIMTTPNYKSFMTILDRIVNTFSKVDYKTQNINKHHRDKILKLLENTSFNDFEVKKILNVGIFFGIINLNLSQIIQKFIYRFTNGKYGYLLMIVVKK